MTLDVEPRFRPVAPPPEAGTPPEAGPPRPGAADDPELGVIEEARERRHSRRRRIAMSVPVLALTAGIVAAVLSGGGHGGTHRRPASPRSVPGAWRLPGDVTTGARISPSLTGGEFGWNLMLGHGGGGTCCTVPLRGEPLTNESWSSSGKGIETATFLVGPELAAITLDGHGVPFTYARLPYGLRLVQVTISLKGHPSPAALGAPGATPQLVALDRRGRRLRAPLTSGGAGVQERWWKRPSRPPPGPCRLSAAGLPGLTAQWGHVAGSVPPYGRAITGRAFLSCIDTEYYLERWPLDAAILLDAQHPGRAPAPLPEMTPVAGAPGFFSSPGGWNGALTAERMPRWWVVVAGGRGITQRLAVLRHLSAQVHVPSSGPR